LTNIEKIAIHGYQDFNIGLIIFPEDIGSFGYMGDIANISTLFMDRYKGTILWLIL